MNKQERITPEIKTGRLDQACIRYSIGQNTMRQVAEDAGAVIRIERIALKRIEADAEEASRRRAELREDYIRLWEKKGGEPTEEDLEIIDQIVETDLRYELLHRGS